MCVYVHVCICVYVYVWVLVCLEMVSPFESAYCPLLPLDVLRVRLMLLFILVFLIRVCMCVSARVSFFVCLCVIVLGLFVFCYFITLPREFCVFLSSYCQYDIYLILLFLVHIMSHRCTLN